MVEGILSWQARGLICITKSRRGGLIISDLFNLQCGIYLPINNFFTTLISKNFCEPFFCTMIRMLFCKGMYDVSRNPYLLCPIKLVSRLKISLSARVDKLSFVTLEVQPLHSTLLTSPGQRFNEVLSRMRYIYMTCCTFGYIVAK